MIIKPQTIVPDWETATALATRLGVTHDLVLEVAAMIGIDISAGHARLERTGEPSYTPAGVAMLMSEIRTRGAARARARAQAGCA